MGNTKKPTSERSRITRPTAPKAPRAARKKTTLPDTAAEALAPAADVVSVLESVSGSEPEPEPLPEPELVSLPIAVAAPPAPVTARPDEPTQPIPWVPFREQARARATTWLGLDARAIVRGAVRRIGRAIGRRFPLVGRVGGFIFRAW